MSGEVSALAARIGHDFADLDLLAQALMHPSISQGRNKSRNGTAYERFEFLGDRVLGLVVAEMLFRQFPSEPEGALARRHAALVRRETLARVADAIDLGPHVMLSKSEDDAGGRTNPAMLADACEAVIGALYMDGGFDVARRFILGRWRPLMEENAAPPKDAKTALQEWAQGLGKPLPVYAVETQDGPSHDPVFLVSVSVEGEDKTTARGPSKRVAEQAAAKTMLEKVKR